MGGLESVSRTGTSALISIAGQVFEVSAEDVDGLVIGDYVVAASGSGASPVVYQVGLPYVPGVSPTRVRGTVSAADMATGRLTVGELSIDYTQLLSSDPTLSPAVAGQTIEAVGVQPASGRVLIVNSAGGSVSVVVDSADAGGATASRE